MRTRIHTALAIGVVSTALALAGCSGDDSEVGTGTAPGESAAASQETQGAEDAATATAEIPEGYQEVTAPTSGLSFAVPQDWVDLKTLSSEDIQAMAEQQGIDPQTLQQQIGSLDAFYRAVEPGEGDLADNVTVEARAFPLTETPTEADVAELLAGQGIELDQYATVETANGEAATGTYTNPQNEVAKAEVVIAPTSDGSYAVLYVTTSSAERTAELVSDIAGSIH